MMRFFYRCTLCRKTLLFPDRRAAIRHVSQKHTRVLGRKKALADEFIVFEHVEGDESDPDAVLGPLRCQVAERFCLHCGRVYHDDEATMIGHVRSEHPKWILAGKKQDAAGNLFDKWDKDETVTFGIDWTDRSGFQASVDSLHGGSIARFVRRLSSISTVTDFLVDADPERVPPVGDLDGS